MCLLNRSAWRRKRSTQRMVGAYARRLLIGFYYRGVWKAWLPHPSAQTSSVFGKASPPYVLPIIKYIFWQKYGKQMMFLYSKWHQQKHCRPARQSSPSTWCIYMAFLTQNFSPFSSPLSPSVSSATFSPNSAPLSSLAAAAQVEAEKCADIAREVTAKQLSCEADLAAAEPLVAQVRFHAHAHGLHGWHGQLQICGSSSLGPCIVLGHVNW